MMIGLIPSSLRYSRRDLSEDACTLSTRLSDEII